MVSLSTLSKTAAIGGMVTSGVAVFVKQNFETKVRNTKTYKRALEKVYNHEKTVEHLGQPIKEGKIIFNDSANDDNLRKFSVNLKGSNTKGKLNCEFIIMENAKTELKKLEIRFADLPNKVFVLHENL